MFLLALEIEFEKGLYLHNAGYDTDVNYDLPQPLKKSAHMYVVTSVAETSFNPMGYQGSTVSIFPSALKGRSMEPPFY